MAKYEDFKKKAKDALETLADVSAEAYRAAEEKARILAKRARLNSEIAREKTLIRRSKIEIGIKYYELHKDDPEEAFKENVDAITNALASIEAKRSEIEELKKSGTKCDCGDPACGDDEACCDDETCCGEASGEASGEEAGGSESGE